MVLVVMFFVELVLKTGSEKLLYTRKRYGGERLTRVTHPVQTRCAAVITDHNTFISSASIRVLRARNYVATPSSSHVMQYKA
jgi:hypothetical protein